MLKREVEHEEEERMHRLMHDLHFTEQEVEQFRIIMRSWVKREADKAAEIAEGAPKDPPEGLKVDGVRRLVRSLGVSLDSKNAETLTNKVESMYEDGILNFFGFLQLMRWLMDVNFAGINDAAAKMA